MIGAIVAIGIALFVGFCLGLTVAVVAIKRLDRKVDEIESKTWYRR